MYFYSIWHGAEDGGTQDVFYSEKKYSNEELTDLINSIAIDVIKENSDKWQKESDEYFEYERKQLTEDPRTIEIYKESLELHGGVDGFLKYKKEKTNAFPLARVDTVLDIVFDKLVSDYGFFKLKYETDIEIYSLRRINGLKKCDVCGKEYAYSLDDRNSFHNCIGDKYGTDIG